jgi:hypothetical protein
MERVYIIDKVQQVTLGTEGRAHPSFAAEYQLSSLVFEVRSQCDVVSRCSLNILVFNELISVRD